MTVYTTLPQDDSNLDVTLTESNDLVTLDITPAAVSVSGAVQSVNGLAGIVVLDTDDIPQGTTNLYYSNALVDNHLTGGVGVTYTAGDISIGQDVGTTADVTFNSVTADMFGVQHFTAKARETITAGQPVYISGHSGNTPEVMVADYADPLKMPAFGIASADIANNNNGAISTYGDLKNVDTTGTDEGETWAVGDELFVNGSKLTNVRPSLESQEVQKIAKIIRVHPNVGQMFLLGAGRSNDIPNLTSQHVFIGNGTGYDTRQLDYTDILNTPDLSPYALTSYVNTQDGATLTSANNYTDTALIPYATTSYVGTQDGLTLASANNYTDTQIAAIPPVDLSAYYTSTQVNALPVSTFSNDAGYLTTETDSQTLSFANPNLSISNGNTVDLSALTPTSLDWTAITSTPTTLSGYGITDGYTDANAVSALEANADTTLTGNLTVNGDFVVLEQVKINNFEFPLTNAGRTDQWVGNAYDLNAANAYTKFQLRTNDPTITFNTSDFFDDVNNLRTIYIQVDFRGGNGGINWPTNVIWDGQSEPNFATGGNDRHIVVATGNGTNGWFAYVEQVVNPANPSSTTGKLSHYNLLDVGDITDGTAGQVLSTNADGTFTFVDQSGGGGSIALDDLTDVGILNLQNNDLLMYNSTAAEWQNTNLGVSVTPTLSGPATTFTGQPYTFTVTNHATYDDPAYFVEVYDGATLVVANSAVTDNLDGTLTFTVPSTVTTYQIRVKAQDFGDLQSELATLDFDSEQFGGTFRYWKFSVTGSTDHAMIDEIQFFSGGGQTTPLTVGPMTSNTTPVPLVAASPYIQGGYDPYECFAGNTGTFTGWWSLAFPTAQRDGAYLTLDHGSNLTVGSFKFWTGYPTYFKTTQSINVYGSATGAFAGEETFIGSVQNPGNREMNLG